ncbi:MAG: preprotein translocase subunit SecG [Deltaproteobacteria bacterium]|nr:preprotein translocase subunit SecG [Deltaproteobacteria bacterium]
MITITTIIHIIVSIIIIIAVLLQVGKGASIGSSFGGSSSQTIFGSAGPATMLTKITYICVAIFMLTSLFLTYNSSKQRSKSIMSDVPAVAAPEAAQPQAPVEQPVPAQK